MRGFCFSLKLDAGMVVYSRSAFCVRYFQALISNMGLLKYKEIYAAAAEVLGLALQYIAGRENVSDLYCALHPSLILNSVYLFCMTTQFLYDCSVQLLKRSVFKSLQPLFNRWNKNFKLLRGKEFEGRLSAEVLPC